MKTFFTDFLHRFAPPVIYRALVDLSHLRHGMGYYTFQGRYASLSAVPCGAGAYDDLALARRIVSSRRPNLEAALNHPAANVPQVDDNGRTILPLVAAAYVPGGLPVSIVDFGGGLGVGLVNMLAHLPALKALIAAGRLHYVIVETPAMCTAVEEVFAGVVTPGQGAQPFWQIRSRLPEPDAMAGTVVIANLASVLQYVEDWSGLLGSLVRLQPRHVVISETPVTEAGTYARMQCNMPHRPLATWVFNRVDLVAAMAGHGYDVRFQAAHAQPLRIADEPPGYPSAMTSFVFERVAP